MTIASYQSLLQAAGRDRYAVGYFESWNLESLLAVADAAEEARSPVIIGVNGELLFHHGRVAAEPPEVHAALLRAVASRLTVPVALLLNESPHMDRLIQGLELGFNAVMFSDARLDYAANVSQTRRLVEAAHAVGASVEGELGELPSADPAHRHGGRLTDPEQARAYVAATGVDALAVSVGNVHILEGEQVEPDLDRIARVREAAEVPLVLHGGTGISPDALRPAIELGVAKVNYGTRLKRAFLNAVQKQLQTITPETSVHALLGDGGAADVMAAGRLAMRREVVGLMHVLGSAGRALNGPGR